MRCAVLISRPVRLGPSCGWGQRQACTRSRRSLRRLMLGSLALVAPVILQAQSSATDAPLTLAESVELALAQHPAMRAAMASSEQARALVRGAEAAKVPTLTITASAVRYQYPMLVTPLHGIVPGQAPPFDKTLIQGMATMSYTLFDGGARSAGIRRARVHSAAAEEVLDASRQALVAQVVVAYAQVLAKQQVLDAHDRRIAAIEAELARTRQRFVVGRAPAVETLRAEAALANAEAERVHFATALELAERDLTRLVGADYGDIGADRLVPIALADSTQPSREDVVRAALESNPAVERARRLRTAADAAVNVARAGRWPELKLSAAYYQRGGAATAYRDDWSLGTMLAFPLFTGGATGAEVSRAHATRRDADAQFELARLQLKQDIDRALSAIEEAYARRVSLTSAVARFAEVARIERLALEAGSGTQADYLGAEADLLGARAGLAEVVMSEITARAELARITGQLDLGWLQRAIEAKP